MTWLDAIPRFRIARQALSDLAQHEFWSRVEIESYQLERLNEVWASAYREVPYYRDLKRQHLLPEKFRSICEYVNTMPLLPKSIVRNNPHAFYSASASPGNWHRTGGSTGDPLKVYWSHHAHLEMLQAKYRMEQSFGVDFTDRKAMLWGHHSSFDPGWFGRIERWKQKVYDRTRRRLRLNAYRLGPHELNSHINGIQAFRPTSLYGYSSAVYTLARHALQTNQAMDSLQLCTLTAEPAPEFFIKTTEEALGCRATVEYGSVECGLIASGNPDRSLRIREDRVLCETIPEAGEQYGIVVTVLNNPSFPLLRYQIEDRTCQPIEKTEQGFSRLASVLGRNNDSLISRNGTWVHSMAIKHILEADPKIRRFRVFQRAHGDLDLIVEPFRISDSIDKDRICNLLSEMVDGYDVNLRFVETLEGNRAGKHRWIISEKSEQMLDRKIC
jgi:phenylacetate-CoA ligase